MLLFGGKMKSVNNYEQELNYILYQYRFLSKRKIKPFLPLMHNYKQNKQKFNTQAADNGELISSLALFGKEQKTSPNSDHFGNNQEQQLEKNRFADYLSGQNQKFFEEELSEMVKKFALFKVEQQSNAQKAGEPEKQQNKKRINNKQMLFELDENKNNLKDGDKCEIQQIRSLMKREDNHQNPTISQDYQAKALSDQKQKATSCFITNLSELKSSSSKENTTKSNLESKSNQYNQEIASFDSNYKNKHKKQIFMQYQKKDLNLDKNSTKLKERDLQHSQVLQTQNHCEQSIQNQIICLTNSKPEQVYLISENIKNDTILKIQGQKVNREVNNQRLQDQFFTIALSSNSVQNSQKKVKNEQLLNSQGQDYKIGTKLTSFGASEARENHAGEQVPNRQSLKLQAQPANNHEQVQNLLAKEQPNYTYQQIHEKGQKNYTKMASYICTNYQPQQSFPFIKQQSTYSNRSNYFLPNTQKTHRSSQQFNHSGSNYSKSCDIEEEIQPKINRFHLQNMEKTNQTTIKQQRNPQNPLKQIQCQEYKKKTQALKASQGKSYATCFKKQKEQLDEKEKVKKPPLKAKKTKASDSKIKKTIKKPNQIVIEHEIQQVDDVYEDDRAYLNGQREYNQNHKVQVQESFQETLLIQSQPLKIKLNQQSLVKRNYEATVTLGTYQKSVNQHGAYDAKENSHIKTKSVSGTKSEEQYNLLKLMGGSDNLKQLSSLLIQPKQTCFQIQKQELARFMAANSICVKSEHSFDQSEDISIGSSTFRFSPNNLTAFNLADALKEDSKRGANHHQISQKSKNNYRKTQPNVNEEQEDLNLNEESASESSNFVNCKKFINNVNSLEMAVIEELESNKIMSSSTSHVQVYPLTQQDYRNHFNPKRALSKLKYQRGISNVGKKKSTKPNKQYQSLSPSKRVEGSIQGIKERWQKNVKRFKTKMHYF